MNFYAHILSFGQCEKTMFIFYFIFFKIIRQTNIIVANIIILILNCLCILQNTILYGKSHQNKNYCMENIITYHYLV